MFQTALVRSLSDPPQLVRRWTLDVPRHDRGISVISGTIHVQGWLLLHVSGPKGPRLLVRRGASSTEVSDFPFNSGRPDVIERVLGEKPVGHPQLRCGFSLRLPAPDDNESLQLGFELADGTTFWAASIELRPRLPVIVGQDDWLFLDNDTNRSVDQYTGLLKLDPPTLAHWRRYFAESRALATRVGARHALVFAPPKEEVLRERYPYARGAVTVLDQVRTAAAAEDHLVDAASILASHLPPEACFKQTDTHWTDRGAMLVTIAVVAELGLSADTARERFSKDRYHTIPHAGDLGIKFAPVRKPPTEFLDGPPGEAGAIFDNRLPNFGRLLVFEQADPCFDARLLFFGASSGYAMLKYLKRLFRRIVFVHSAANVDVDIVNYERPDALLLQSNGRFLVQPPVVGYSLREVTCTKLTEASDAVRRHVGELLARGPASSADAPYFDLLRP